MGFSKNDYRTKEIARKGGLATAKKWAAIREARAREARRPQEEAKYKAFEEAYEGIFNGFEMINVFHEKIDKGNAILMGQADDCAKCHDIDVGQDGIFCYFFVEPEKVKKQVRFNTSVYLF